MRLSTLMISAPRSASRAVQYGPAMARLRSTTVIPSSGFFMRRLATFFRVSIHDSICSVGMAAGSPVIRRAIGGTPSLVGMDTTMFARS